MSREFSIDMIPGGTQTAVHCNQFESGDTWDFALYYNGGRYTIPEDAEVSITGTKADGAAYQVDGEVVNNAVRIEVTEQMTAAAGKTVAEILVVSDTDGTTLYSANFPVIVEPAAVQADLSPSEIPTAIVGPDGTVYYSEEAILSEDIPSEVRQALYTLLNSNAYAATSLTDELAVIQSWAQEITAISVSPATVSITGTGTSQMTATTTPAGRTVTWSSSDTSVATVSDTGLVTGVGNGTCIITASAGEKSATCAVTVSGAVSVTSIEAVYTPSGTVYTNASLESLKNDTVVTATYSDSSTAVVTTYTLSGTLTGGSNTITVSYGGQTDTITVLAVPSTFTVYDYVTGTASGQSTSRVVQTDIILDPAGCAYDVSIRYKPLSSMSGSAGGQPLLGCRNTAATNTTDAFAFYANKTTFGYHIFGQDCTPHTIASVADAVNTANWHFVDGGTSVLTVNGTDYNFGPMAASEMTASEQPLYLFGSNKAGTPVTGSYTHQVQVGEIKFSKGGPLLYDFKPAYNSTTQKYGFYEAVNGNFYAATSGLTAGNWS